MQNVKVDTKLDATNAQDADEVETRRERYERMFFQYLPSCVLECLSKQKTEGEEQDVPDDMEAEEEEEQEVSELETYQILNVRWIDGWMSCMRPSIKAFF